MRFDCCKLPRCSVFQSSSQTLKSEEANESERRRREAYLGESGGMLPRIFFYTSCTEMQFQTPYFDK